MAGFTPIGRIRVNVTGARGALGIEFDTPPVAGRFIAKAPGGERKFIDLTGATPANAVALTDLAGPNGAGLSGFTQSSSDAVNQSLAEKIRRDVPGSPYDYGAIGNGVADDRAAVQAAIDNHDEVLINGLFFISGPVRLRDQVKLLGLGLSPWEPYIGGGAAFPVGGKSEIIADGNLILDANGTKNAKVYGVNLKSKGGRQSTFTQPAGAQPGSIGIDISNAYHFEGKDIGFFGLEKGVYVAPKHTLPCQMPMFTRWLAVDCKCVFSFGDNTSLSNTGDSPYIARDIRIGECVIALRCDDYFVAYKTDGYRVENSRIFPGYGSIMRMYDVPYISTVGLTSFETGGDAYIFEDCPYANMAGAKIARTGGYAAGNIKPQRRAITLRRCVAFAFEGEIAEPSGEAILLEDCDVVSVSGVIDTPFWTTGNATNATGAVNLVQTASSMLNPSTSLNIAFGGNGHWVNVVADKQSSRGLNGKCSMSPGTGMVRASQLQYQNSFKLTVQEPIDIGPGGVASLGWIRRVWIPSGKILTSRSVEQNSPIVQMRVVNNLDTSQAVIWNNTPETDGGTISNENKPIYSNTGPDGFYDIEITLRNPATGGITVPAGHTLIISAAIV